MTYLLGIDGGGTACRASLVGPDGDVLGMGQAGPANVATTVSGAIASVLAAARAALDAAGLDLDCGDLKTGLGLAGANAAGVETALANALPFRRMRITTDATTAAMGALGRDDGIVAAIGTGSVFVAQRGGHLRQVGGWGLALGDEGSGAQMGRTLLACVVKMADGRLPATPLLAAVLQDMGSTAEIVSFATRATPADFAALAPRVLQAEDPAAEDIRRAFAQEVAEIIAFLQPDPPLPVVFLGGLGAFYQQRLDGRWQVHPARGSALDGALVLAAEVA
ncbi:MAG: ATPase [Rhodobacter sp.]|nr:ATPase [Rhodobacter sp.]